MKDAAAPIRILESPPPEALPPAAEDFLRIPPLTWDMLSEPLINHEIVRSQFGSTSHTATERTTRLCCSVMDWAELARTIPTWETTGLNEDTSPCSYSTTAVMNQSGKINEPSSASRQ